MAATIALSVRDMGSGRVRDVLVRGSPDQTMAELTTRLAEFLGLEARDALGKPRGYALHVERTGEYLRPTATLARADLLEGDTLLLRPAQTPSPSGRGQG
jgi:hypothetical protein